MISFVFLEQFRFCELRKVANLKKTDAATIERMLAASVISGSRDGRSVPGIARANVVTKSSPNQGRANIRVVFTAKASIVIGHG
jgi:hypothetical protein